MQRARQQHAHAVSSVSSSYLTLIIVFSDSLSLTAISYSLGPTVRRDLSEMIRIALSQLVKVLKNK